jgi:hypothetical protein
MKMMCATDCNVAGGVGVPLLPLLEVPPELVPLVVVEVLPGVPAPLELGSEGEPLAEPELKLHDE